MPSNSSAGFNAMFEISTDDGANYTLVLEGRDFKRKKSRKMMDATSHSSGDGETFKPGRSNWTGSVEALRVHGDAGQDAIESALDNSTRLKVRWRPKGVGVGKPEHVGYCFIDDFDESEPNTDLIAVNVSLRGDGSLVKSVQ